MTKFKCKKCGHEWITRLEYHKPVRCPRCFNVNWDKERARDGKRK